MMNQKQNSKKEILLVQPDFPIPTKRKINHDFLPIGLLKIGTYFKHAKKFKVELIFGNAEPEINPDEIWITSLFTYWSEYVHNSAQYYHSHFPKAKLRVGGIYATLLPGEAKEGTGGLIHKGVYRQAEDWCEKHEVDYSILGENIDFQILHGMRGCFRKCKFCGVWKLEPKEEFCDSIANQVVKNHVVFYDNNFLRHPEVERILRELAEKRINGRVVHYESQSGFDGRILTPEIAQLLKNARFINPRIAWDGSFEDSSKIKRQIDLLDEVSFNRKNIYVFMLFNWDLDYETMEKKRLKCWEWKVQIADCRNRPLTQMYDHFSSRKNQTRADYYIHPNWTDEEVKAFRRNVRQHNICVRHSYPFYSWVFERMRVSKKTSREFRKLSKAEIRKKVPDAWFPDDFQPAPISQQHIEDYNDECVKMLILEKIA